VKEYKTSELCRLLTNREVIKLDLTKDVQLEALLSFDESLKVLGSVDLLVEPGAFYECTIPENIESLWGPIPLDSLPQGNKYYWCPLGTYTPRLPTSRQQILLVPSGDL